VRQALRRPPGQPADDAAATAALAKRAARSGGAFRRESGVNPHRVGRDAADRPESGIDRERSAWKTSYQDQAGCIREPADQLCVDPSPHEARGRQGHEHRDHSAMAIIGIDEEPTVRAEPQASTAPAGDEDASPFEIASVFETRAERLLNLG
jgi:hypothetical protein